MTCQQFRCWHCGQPIHPLDANHAAWCAMVRVGMPSQADEMKEKGKDDGLDARLRAVAEM